MSLVAASKLGNLVTDYHGILENLSIGLEQLNECAELLLTETGETDPRLETTFKQALQDQYALEKEKELIQSLRQEVGINPQAKDFVKRFNELNTELTNIEQRPEYQEFKRKIVMEEEEDEEIAMVSQKISIHCPLTRIIMTIPYTSKTCHHSFSEAVLDYLSNGPAECPVAGCNRYLKLQDMYKDKKLARLIQRETLQMEEEEFNLVSDAESQ
jgi:hypothetical protein